MGLYADHVLPRMIDWGMSGETFSRERAPVVSRPRGRVLEIGFGSGLNLPHYSDEVERLYALDPATVGRKLAAERIADAPFPVEFVALDEGRYALETGSVDAVLSTWTLCTIPDLEAALAEVRRVLVPGGTLHFLEHGLSESPRVARWQRRLNRLQMWYAGGCRLDRDAFAAVRSAGFTLVEDERYRMKGQLAIHGAMYRGVARSD